MNLRRKSFGGMFSQCFYTCYMRVSTLRVGLKCKNNVMKMCNSLIAVTTFKSSKLKFQHVLMKSEELLTNLKSLERDVNK